MIGIIGNGFVGNAVYQNLRDKVECKVYDVDKNRSPNTLDEVLKQNFIFVCLPTPMKENGECDLSILDQFFENIFWDNPDIEGTFVIFPSHLNHLVPKHRYRETRITLSGNILIKDSRFAKCL